MEKQEKEYTPNRDYVIAIARPGKGTRVFRIRKPMAIFVCFALLFGFGSLVKGAYTVQQAKQEQQELMTYRAQYARQEEKLQALLAENEKIQKSLAEVAALEAEVRRTLDQDDNSGVSRGGIDRASHEADLKGQGGPGKIGLSNMDVLSAQNKQIEERIAYKYDNLNNMLEQLEQKSVTPNLWPTDCWEISSRYGTRYNPFGEGTEFHPGIDIPAGYGEPVYASAAGYVEDAGWYGGYGRYIKISHGNSYETAYGHLSSIDVAAGESVKKGDIIGYVGSSGYSTGPHLHFEVLVNGETINPLKVLN
ncbi:MAG: M23 family metallopeptidase [Negativicutes bacterium]|nr:M23 family metallopeptidase [Negativicutes bacterium]